MIVCVCNRVSERDIRKAVAEGVSSFAELQACTRCSTTCGRCKPMARQIFDEALAARTATATPVPAAPRWQPAGYGATLSPAH